MGQRKAFLLRIDPELWTAIERLAHSELRSANAQVEYLLRESLARRGALGGRAAPVPGAKGPRDDDAASADEA